MITVTYTDRNLVEHSVVLVGSFEDASAYADRLVDNGHVYDVDGEHLIRLTM